MAEGATIKGMEIFAVGKHRDKDYTPRDLANMVENFRKFSTGSKPLLRVPAVLGHEETQEFLDRSDLPAAAWCDRVYTRGGKLLSDWSNVPPKVAKLLNRKAYRRVSAEVYDEPPEGIPGQGKMLRRVAFLGGEIPQVKSLDDIPMVEEHAERGERFRPVVTKFSEARRRPRAGTWVVFGEVRPMNRDDMLQMLARHGVDVEVCRDCPDQVLAEMLRVIDSKADAAASGMGGNDVNPTQSKAMWAQVDDAGDGKRKKDGDYDDDKMQGEWHTRMGENGDDVPEPKDDDEREAMKSQALKMFDRVRKMMDKCGYKMAEAGKFPENSSPDLAQMADASSYFQAVKPQGSGQTGPASDSQVTGTSGEGIKFSERQVRKIVDAAVAQVRKEFGGIREQTEQLAANTKRANITKFCETMVQAGKVAPAELDPGDPKNPRPTLIDRLMRADARTTVHKFSENGKEVKLTELDLQMREIETRPQLVRFGERLKGGGAMAGRGTDAEVEKVEAHFEQFREQFERHGTKREDLVSGFKAARDRNRDLKAEDYLLAN